MSEIPDDIMEAAANALDGFTIDDGTVTLFDRCCGSVANAILLERNRCISIAQSIDPHNEAEAHLIETIVRMMRGDE